MSDTGCLDLPESKVQELIRKTDEEGIEHAFVMCDGSIEGTFTGDEDSLEFETDCDSPAVVFHTHPNDTLELSPQDRRVLNRENIAMMCVGDTNGRYICERDGYACAVDTDDLGAAHPSDGVDVSPIAVHEETGCEWFNE